MINWRFYNTPGRTGHGCKKREAPAKSGRLNRYYPKPLVVTLQNARPVYIIAFLVK